MASLTIERLAYGGDAIARLDDGRTVFVEGGCPGDIVDAEIIEDRDRFARARVLQVIQPSPDRVIPPCPYFGACGGCNWQHVAYTRQLEAKRSAVVDTLERIGRIKGADSLVAPCEPSFREYGYRNKLEFVTDPAADRLRLGFHRSGSGEVVEVERCLLLPKQLQSVPKSLGGALRYIAGESDLGISRVGVRAAVNTRDVEVALWTTPGAFPRAVTAKTLGQAVKTTSLVRVLSRGESARRQIAGVEVLAGKGRWRERLAGLTYSVSAPSFFQVNTPGAERLVQLAIEVLEPDGSDRVVDLFAGAGTFTLPLAELAGEVIAVESASSAVRDLRRNLEEEQVWADVVGGDATREIAAIGGFDKLLVDPPRAGVEAGIIDAIAAARPARVCYISCDPATLARDAERMAQAGYALTSATPVDLFPQTFHVETVALFEPVTGTQ